MTNHDLKVELTEQELEFVAKELDNRKKSMVLAYVLWIFLWPFGAHRFYMGRTGTALLQLVSVGGLVIWALVDGIFNLHRWVNHYNEEQERLIILERLAEKEIDDRHIAHAHEVAATTEPAAE